jgi:hypothetical protein
VRVLVAPADDGACGFNRMRWPAEALKAQGADVAVVDTIPEMVWIEACDGEPMVVGALPLDADVLVLQRPLKRELATAIPYWQAQGVAVVVELDDDFRTVHRANPAIASADPHRNPASNWQHLERACSYADLVTATTPGLIKRYAPHGRGVVLPNYVPARYLSITPDPRHRKDLRTVVGWAGSTKSHPEDLEVARGRIAKAVHDTGARFRVVGTGEGVAERLRLREVPERCGWLDLLKAYPLAVATLDVGVVPLAPNPFNNLGKSALKLAELASLGVAAVASPTDDNRRLHKLGVGLLAYTPADWYRHLRVLITNPARRKELALRSRAAMRDQTYEARCDDWWTAWVLARTHLLASSVPSIRRLADVST